MNDDDREILIGQLAVFASLDPGTAGNEQYLHAFAEDALLVAPNRPVLKGRTAIRASYDEMLGAVQAGHVRYEDARVDIEGALAVRLYKGTAVLRYADDTTERHVARYLDVLRKQPDGTWLITVHMWSNSDSNAD